MHGVATYLLEYLKCGSIYMLFVWGGIEDLCVVLLIKGMALTLLHLHSRTLLRAHTHTPNTLIHSCTHTLIQHTRTHSHTHTHRVKMETLVNAETLVYQDRWAYQEKWLASMTDSARYHTTNELAHHAGIVSLRSSSLCAGILWQEWHRWEARAARQGWTARQRGD